MRSPGLLFCSLLLIPGVATSQPAPPAARVDSGPVPVSVGVARSQLPRAATLETPPWLPGNIQAATAQDTGGLTVQLESRLESRLERNRNDRCAPGQSTLFIVTCRSPFQPLFDFDFNLTAGGSIANRISVAVDYDSRREFDASNNISIAYQGRPGETIRRAEIGNLSFVPPFSRFISTGVPSGNYGAQVEGAIGSFVFQGIAARQKGRVVRAESFTVGDRALRAASAVIEDFAFEPRRFFFTVDPTLFAGYPNIDILNGAEMLAHSAALPDTLRPRRLQLYRVLLGGQPPNPNGPRFIARGSRNLARGLVYEPLREGIDYYSDPSLLWIALVRQLRRDERLVVAYNVLLADGTTVYPGTGGTPDLEFRPEPQFANVLWDPELQPVDPAFQMEIRSAYRIAGEDLVRESVRLRVVTGPGAGQEKPASGDFTSYLDLLGVAEPANPGGFDRENRIWPRLTDPNYNRGGGGSGSTLVGDYFLVFPSLRPFSREGLIPPGNPANESIYSALADDIYSSRRPETVYRMPVNFATQDDAESGSLSLGNIQVRPGSERLVMDGVLLVRDVDYVVDYELGRVNFNRPDTLFATRREISIQYEENPLFAQTPTTMFALAGQLPVPSGILGFTAIHQRQSSTFSRPVLGFEPASSLLAGANAAFTWELAPRAGSGGAETTRRPQLRLDAELATSRPDRTARNIAHVESFQSEGGLSAGSSEPEWYFSSVPVTSALLPAAVVAESRAATITWQNSVLGADGNPVTFRSGEIDPNIAFVGQFSVPERLLWLTLYPLSVGGARGIGGAVDWSIAGTQGGSRWRSLRTPLSPSGADLTRAEHIEFWALIDTSLTGRSANPTFVIDLGDVSENSLTFSPDTLLVTGAQHTFAGYRGKKVQGVDVVNSERDPFSRAFDATVNDTGLPGHVADRLLLRDDQSSQLLGDSLSVRTCLADRRVLAPGDWRANCTAGNARLDEEDMDGDGVLNFPAASERLFRFAVNMADPGSYDRVGGCVSAGDPRNVAQTERCWVHFRIPIGAAEIIGTPLLRRVKSLRLTMISGVAQPDDGFTVVPITPIQLAGAPWEKRSDRSITGIAGVGESDGFVSLSLIGTQDSSATLRYQPPPGVQEEAPTAGGEYVASQTQINERSLRVRATAMKLYERAEAFFRFPDGQKSFMGYTQLRVWARGRNSGWGGAGSGSGEEGELNFFVRIGRDADNFYLYRAPANSGLLRSAWEPEVRVDFGRFFRLRSLVQEAVQRGAQPQSSCTATDSALVAASLSPPGGQNVFACDGPYLIHTVDAIVSPPSLGAVQELAVGIVRVREGGGADPITPGDTLELWVDEIRLTGPVAQPGYAGYVGLELSGSGMADVRVSITHRDRNFRQLTEQPSFVTQNTLNVASTFRLDRVGRGVSGWSLPLTISHSTLLGDPFFVTQSDIPGADLGALRTPRDSRTVYSLSARRTAPSNGSLFQDILSMLAFSGQYAASGVRSEYSDGGGSRYALGVDFLMQRPAAMSADTAVPAPGRWSPTLLRFSTQLSRSSDARRSFLNPVASPADPGLRSADLAHFWHSSGVVELRPATGLVARWELNSDRDLREYGDTTQAGVAATAARSSLLGADIGMERDRATRGQITYNLSPTPWLATRFSLGTRFSMQRDPNARFLVAADATADPDRLPARYANSQQATAGFTLNFARLASAMNADSSRAAAVGRVLGPLDVNFTRGLLSTFSAAASAPSFLYQLSLGDAAVFRRQDGHHATSSGLSNALAISHVVRPWRGASLTNRVVLSGSSSWSGAVNDLVSEVDGDARTFPDMVFRIERTTPLAGSLIRSATAHVGVRRTVRTLNIPAILPGIVADHSRDVAVNTPAGVSIDWGILGGLSSSAEYNLSTRDDSRPGVRIAGNTHTAAAELRKVFRAGSIAGLSQDVRTQLSFRSSRTISEVSGSEVGQSSRLVDNGRYSLGFSADSDVSDTMVLSLGASQVVTYDHNFNRRFTQTIFSLILQINFVTAGFR